MKIRWILLVALVHLGISSLVVDCILPRLFLTRAAASPDALQQLQAWQFWHSLFTFPVGFLRTGGLPFFSMAINSLFWGWMTMGIITFSRECLTPKVRSACSHETAATRVVRPFLLQALVLALFCLSLSPVAAGSAVLLFALLLIALTLIRTVVRRLAGKLGFTSLRQTVLINGGIAAMLAVVALMTVAPWPSFYESKIEQNGAMSLGQRLERLKEIQKGPIPFQLLMAGSFRWRTDFNVNRYFAVLDHLTPESGYALDYVYACSELYGAPIVYARRKWAVPYLTYSAYRNTRSEAQLEEKSEFLQHVLTDGTPDGFIQFVALHIMADQFYIFWHAGYNDQRIVYDRSQLEALLAKPGIPDHPDSEGRVKASTLDLQPIVEFQEMGARVTLFTWTDWGGLYRKTFTIRREFPHRIQKITEERIIPYNCGVIF
ncbi:MAG: hypothetical protein C0404_09520 [Verrucomicrobia bacterium]|nr:hypothetical protein [Verrucomicrobiota bacterium]